MPRRATWSPRSRPLALADVLGAVDPELERAEIRALLGSAFDVLSQREQDILHLRFDEDFSQAEIAQRIGLSQMQVSRLIARSLARVRLRLERRTTMEARRRAPERERVAAA